MRRALPAIDPITVDTAQGIAVEHPDPLGHVHLQSRKDKTAAQDPVTTSSAPCASIEGAPRATEHVYNTVQLKLPEGLPRSEIPADLAGSHRSDPPPERQNDAVVVTRPLVWSSSGPDVVTFIGSTDAGKDGTKNTSMCMQSNPTQLRFLVLAERAAPLVVPLQLWGATRTVLRTAAGAALRSTSAPDRADRNGDDVYVTPWELLLDLDLPIADKVEAESLKAPIDKALYIECKRGGKVDRQILNGNIAAVDDGAIGPSAGQCELVLDDTKMIQCMQDPDPNKKRAQDCADTKSAALGRLSLFGPQILEVSVRRDGADENKIRWALPAPTAGVLPHRISLPAPLHDDKGSGPYTVSVTVVTTSGYADVSATPADSAGGTTPAPVNAETNFRAFANPRDVFAFPCTHCIRMFLTIPVQLTGFRFPAAPRDLKASSDPTDVQILSPRVGLMVGIEPWNYDLGKNPWLGVRFLTGFHMLQTSAPNVAVSFVTGPSIAVPILDKSQIGTSATLGFFYEADLRDGFTHGSHLVIAAGFNVLSLFGAAPGPGAK